MTKMCFLIGGERSSCSEAGENLGCRPVEGQKGEGMDGAQTWVLGGGGTGLQADSSGSERTLWLSLDKDAWEGTEARQGDALMSMSYWKLCLLV